MRLTTNQPIPEEMPRVVLRSWGGLTYEGEAVQREAQVVNRNTHHLSTCLSPLGIPDVTPIIDL